MQMPDCLMCKLANQHPDHLVYEIFANEQACVFLDRYPLYLGHTLVVPRQHYERAAADCTLSEYLDLQRLIYYVVQAIQDEVRPERVYILSLGSQTGNRHVHWHILPHPMNTPYDEQELIDLRRGERANLTYDDNDMRALAGRIRERLVYANRLAGKGA